MTILVAVASRHGSTHEIADAVAQELRTTGRTVEVRNAGDVGDAERYDAVIIFVGKLDKSELGLGERLATKMVKAPEGDFRDWEAIRAWADDIATALQSSAS